MSAMHNIDYLIICIPFSLLFKFNHIGSGEQLWEGVTGVSNAGRKRGRGKRVGKKRVTDLNKGQKVGDGK